MQESGPASRRAFVQLRTRHALSRHSQRFCCQRTRPYVTESVVQDRTAADVRSEARLQAATTALHPRGFVRLTFVDPPEGEVRLQKGGDPAAGSPTATLLRLHPSRPTLLKDLPPLRVGAAISGATDSHGVTGGVYKARERIHPCLLIRDY